MSEEKETNGNGSVEFKTPLFSARLGGKDMQLRDFVSVGTFIVVALVAYGGYQMGTALTEVIKELAKGQQEMVQAQREQNCLIAFSQDARESKSDFCKRLSK